MSVFAHANFADRRALRTIPQPGLIRTLFRRLLQWRQRRVEHDIAIRLGLTGGRLTDEVERRITERLIAGGGFRN
jgi:hypothetical protein